MPLHYDSKSFVEMNINSEFSPQKTFNKIALSLLGVKRSKVNKSCQSTNFWNKSDKKSSKRYGISQKKDTEVYEHSLYPFRASSI